VKFKLPTPILLVLSFVVVGLEKAQAKALSRLEKLEKQRTPVIMPWEINFARRRGSLDPRVGAALAAVFITAFIAIMVVAQVEPTVSAKISANSTFYTPYQNFLSYTGQGFEAWGLTILVSVFGMLIGAVYAFIGRG
jgi:ABC-type phosphate/phosphonate transport system permease subunit